MKPTERTKAILAAIKEGRPAVEIADEFGISVIGVHTTGERYGVRIADSAKNMRRAPASLLVQNKKGHKSGRIVIPQSVLRRVNAWPGDVFSWTAEDGKLVLTRKSD